MLICGQKSIFECVLSMRCRHSNLLILCLFNFFVFLIFLIAVPEEKFFLMINLDPLQNCTHFIFLQKSAESPLLSSPCSPCSSPRSPSSPLPNSLELSSASCGSLADAPSMLHPRPSRLEDGPAEPHPSSSPLLPNQHLVLAEVHRVPSVTSIQVSPIPIFIGIDLNLLVCLSI